MSRPRIYGERRNVTIRLAPELHDRLSRYRGGKPMNPIIEQALVEYLDRMDRKVAPRPLATGLVDWSTTPSKTSR